MAYACTYIIKYETTCLKGLKYTYYSLCLFLLPETPHLWVRSSLSHHCNSHLPFAGGGRGRWTFLIGSSTSDVTEHALLNSSSGAGWRSPPVSWHWSKVAADSLAPRHPERIRRYVKHPITTLVAMVNIGIFMKPLILYFFSNQYICSIFYTFVKFVNELSLLFHASIYQLCFHRMPTLPTCPDWTSSQQFSTSRS